MLWTGNCKLTAISISVSDLSPLVPCSTDCTEGLSAKYNYQYKKKEE